MTDKSGQAFPGERASYAAGYPTKERAPVPGMTMREHYAGQMMQACIQVCVNDDHPGVEYPDHVARNAVRMADALLKALQS